MIFCSPSYRSANWASEILLRDRTVWQGVELSPTKEDSDYKSLTITLAHVFLS